MSAGNQLLVLLLAACAAVGLVHSFQVLENSTHGTVVGTVNVSSGATDFQFNGEGICDAHFSIDADTGLITVSGVLDREVIVSEIGTDTLSCFSSYLLDSMQPHYLSVNIEVLDINDYTPHFFNLGQPHYVTLQENVALPSPVVQLQPTDQDKGINGTTQFSITNGNMQNFFDIRPPVGDTEESTTERILFLMMPLDFDALENGNTFNITITITDMGLEPLTFDQVVNIAVTNLEDEPPTFELTSYSFMVDENYPINQEFASVQAESDLSSGTVFYTLCNSCLGNTANISNIIRIHQTSGGISLKVPLDYESLGDDKTLVFEVSATNPNSRQVQTAVVNVIVNNLNEESPFFCDGSIATTTCNVNNTVISIVENTPISPSTLFGYYLADNDIGPDPFRQVNDSTLTHQIEPEEGPFIPQFLPTGLGVFRLRIRGTLDREAIPSFTITLSAENLAEPTLRSDTYITIQVLDVNDNAPEFAAGQYSCNVFEGSPVGMEVLTVAAHDPDEGENGTIIYSMSGISEQMAVDWFLLSPENGAITVNSAASINYLDVEGRAITLNITASDNGTLPMSSSVTVEITILPSSTFISGSYQEYFSSDFHLFANTSADFYLEFRTTERNGLLAYQRDSSTGGVFSVELLENRVVVRSGDSSVSSNTNTNVSADVWNYVHVMRTENRVTNLIVAPVSATDDRLQLLHGLTTQTCVNSSTQDHGSSLYIGGLNIFHLPLNTSTSQTGFVGGIRNVVVGGVRLDSTCPDEEVNTVNGVVRSEGCKERVCSSDHASQCVDYTQESYCQCRGGFPQQVCEVTEVAQETESYAPIRFHGNTLVSLNLGYSFFYDLLTVQDTAPGSEDDAPELGTGVGRRRRRRRDVPDQVQRVKIEFRVVELKSAVLMFSRTESSVHLIRLEYDTEDSVSVKYSIMSVPDSQLLVNLSVPVTLQPNTECSVIASTSTHSVTLSFSSSSSDTVTAEQEWEGHPATPFAEQPETHIGIGGASEALFNMSDPYFIGCISNVAIDNLELPLNGLLTAAMEGWGGSGFEVEDIESVERYCDLCNIKVCPESSVCIPDNIRGDAVCDCEGSQVLAEDGTSCHPPPVVTTAGLNTVSANSVVVTYAAGGAGAAVLVMLGVCVILVIVVVRRRQERNKRSTYNINSPLSTQSSLRSKTSNSYTPTIPKRRPSLTPSTHAHCAEAQERSSSVSTYQEHDPEPEFSSPAHHTSKRMRHLSVESGIKMDTDHEASIGRGIPKMEDSGHEVNSTDSARSEVSEDIDSSCFNEQVSGSGRQTISLRIVGSLSNSDQYPNSPHTPRTPLTPLTQRTLLSPHTPLTPKEQKIMIPLRPASTNLSQSEFGDEVTDIDTESFHTRVSSSSGAGGSMQNQGRGSDSENSKSGSSTPQWYKSSTTSDTERENERVQATRAYYPMHHPERGTTRNHKPRFKPSSAHPPSAHPPEYFSPPSFSHHMMNHGHFEGRPRSKSFHSSSVKSPIAKTPPQRYENYPPMFTSETLRNGRSGYKQHVLQCYDSTPPRHERQLSDPRALDDGDYTPTSFTRQYSDPRIPHNGNYCIPRKHHDSDLRPVHSRQMSDPRQSSQQTQDSIMVQPRSSRSLRHIPSPSTYTSTLPPPEPRPYYTLGRAGPDHLHYRANQPGHRFSHDDAPHSDEPFQTLSSLSKIDPISKWDAQARMKIAVDHIDPCHLLSGPYVQFEDVSTDPSVVESQLTIDDSVMGEHQVFETQGGREGTAVMLDPLDMRLARLREDEIDSILTDSEFGQREMNHFPSADCSSQYTATIVAGSTSTSGESTPKMQKVFVIPPSQQSFDV